ncbi:putative NBD/HSP70 family sugar kinase [Actinoplanes octamycinicus]|uniref:Putative NBD/HSP70 family sugar kinase n=1 Tax=Actinoplanes octamycinicus TaxID=135948 RepID=A0A7W7MA22_9ACTN|nr:ROK family transcriptional regulator [Actinoplanes octamycinicus]MBB4742471.1 putative NBD/HSP70 family sugar kinase [Actinoplanes octamycinicus]GIE60809.1 sugar kinase [Actinoplanes octamycinicus]
MHLAYLRDYHEALVIELARTRPAIERGTVAEATGLTPQAVSKVLARLVQEGVIAPAGVRRPALGKPAAVYRLVPESRWAVGAHVTRRALRLVLVDLAGQVHASAATPLPADFSPAQLLAELTAGVAALSAGRTLTGVGIGMIGPLDQARGTVRDAHRLRHWHDVPLAALAGEALGLPVVLDKDVTAGVTAEAWRRGASFRDAALIMVESGLGAGLWLGGAVHRGTHTNAGEFGHTVVQLDGPACVCGRRGCLEAVHDAAADPAAAAAVLGTGVVNLLQTLDLGHVVLAGADLLRHGEIYRAAVAEAVRTQVPRADWLTVEVSLTGLGTDAIAAGAAMQVLNARYGLPAPSVG